MLQLLTNQIFYMLLWYYSDRYYSKHVLRKHYTLTTNNKCQHRNQHTCCCICVKYIHFPWFEWFGWLYFVYCAWAGFSGGETWENKLNVCYCLRATQHVTYFNCIHCSCAPHKNIAKFLKWPYWYTHANVMFKLSCIINIKLQQMINDIRKSLSIDLLTCWFLWFYKTILNITFMVQ